jgi:hypothetical protein
LGIGISAISHLRFILRGNLKMPRDETNLFLKSEQRKEEVSLVEDRPEGLRLAERVDVLDLKELRITQSPIREKERVPTFGDED